MRPQYTHTPHTSPGHQVLCGFDVACFFPPVDNTWLNSRAANTAVYLWIHKKNVYKRIASNHQRMEIWIARHSRDNISYIAMIYDSHVLIRCCCCFCKEFRRISISSIFWIHNCTEFNEKTNTFIPVIQLTFIDFQNMWIFTKIHWKNIFHFFLISIVRRFDLIIRVFCQENSSSFIMIRFSITLWNEREMHTCLFPRILLNNFISFEERKKKFQKILFCLGNASHFKNLIFFELFYSQLTVEYPYTFSNLSSGKCSIRPPPRHSVSKPSARIEPVTSS